MENFVKNLTTRVPFKETTETGDVVVVVQEGERGDLAVNYARVVGFRPDLTKRDAWWQVDFVFLRMPPSLNTIILQPNHFTGQEIFTIGGRKVFIKALDFNGFLNQQGLDDSQNNQPSKRPALKLVK